MDNRFDREEMLIGKEALARLRGARVCLFGVGGVGSYAAEALARAGVGAIDIIDSICQRYPRRKPYGRFYPLLVRYYCGSE